MKTLIQKLQIVGKELYHHSPFTFAGAVLGMVFVYALRDIHKDTAVRLFAIFHPLHVLLSAMVTAALFKIHRKASHFLLILLIGYIGSVGIATISDCLLPYLGQSILGVVIPTESAVHSLVHQHTESDGCCDHAEHPKPRLHLGFIEEWYLVNPAAVLGIVIAYFYPRTKIPHAAHILISTWASASFMLINSPPDLGWMMLAGMLIALFIAVWLPCCISDIVFPAMFVSVGQPTDGSATGCRVCSPCGHHHQAGNETGH